ncbi:hypothetical protein QCI42_30135 [Bacillus fungorum]|uniref:hypothetical protein n=1 Tax=Bacillus fungorum TaxID=2039284 RepID=UPI003391FC62
MWKLKDIFRLTVGRNNKERKYSEYRKPIMFLDDGTPIYPMTAKEGRELGQTIVDGITAGIEAGRKQHKQMLIGIDMGSPVGSFSALPYARETMTINSYGHLHEVYKDDWMREFNKERGFGINSLRNTTK